jgi:lysyl-tRNA synthetase class 2
METNDQVEARLETLRQLREKGINPYPYKFPLTHDSAALKANEAALLASGETVAYAGRVIRYNLKGKIAFIHLKDGFGRMQTMIQKDGVTIDLSEHGWLGTK